MVYDLFNVLNDFVEVVVGEFFLHIECHDWSGAAEGLEWRS
jgi:hypothetical protein